MQHPKTELRNSSIQGTGIFATDKIKAGEIVWWETAEERQRHDEVPVDTVRSWSEEQRRPFLRYAYQIGENLYAGYLDGVARDAADFTNHSCDPTIWFVNDMTMVARRDIEPGEEITYDYATSETDEDFVMACGCGAANCRGIVRGTDHLLPEVQEVYGKHMMQHAVAKVEDRRERTRKKLVGEEERSV
jgi:SET domain-containing protein